MNKAMPASRQKQTYFVKGMHCAACEILIEKKLLEIPGITSVDASTANSQAVIEYSGEKPTIDTLNIIFKKDNYTFSENAFLIKPARNASHNDAGGESNNEQSLDVILVGFAIAMVIVAVFLSLDRLGISGLLNISSKSSVFTFFGFGILAGLSSCAALVGGIVLSMSKQWQAMYAREKSIYKKFQPHVLFNSGRIVSYVVLGGVLGLIGQRLQLSIGFTSLLVIIISLLMIVLGLQMLEVKGFRRVQFSLPKFITRGVANENNFKGKYMPFIMGAATFFLPCGFTITAQTIALLSGSMMQGALIMGFFALGTLPMLLFIGLSSVKLLEKPQWSNTFSKAAGFLVLFFAFYNIYSQITVVGLTFIK